MGRTETEKAVVEMEVFKEFIAKARISVQEGSITKSGAESEPDIFCTMSNGENVAYELVEICSSDIAAALTKISSTISETKVGDVSSFPTSDPTEKTLRNKLHKTYKTTRPIELLCYTYGRTVSSDQMIIDEACIWANAINGPFRKVWLLGEKNAHEVWSKD